MISPLHDLIILNNRFSFTFNLIITFRNRAYPKRTFRFFNIAMTRMRKLTATAGAVIATAYGGTLILHSSSISANDFGGGSHLDALRKKLHAPGVVVPSRESQQSALMAASKANPLDVLVIGGGATGAGAALDAVTRGLNVGLVEREDFASGTSSRSTKLLHGGRYITCARVLVNLQWNHELFIYLFILYHNALILIYNDFFFHFLFDHNIKIFNLEFNGYQS